MEKALLFSALAKSNEQQCQCYQVFQFPLSYNKMNIQYFRKQLFAFNRRRMTHLAARLLQSVKVKKQPLALRN